MRDGFARRFVGTAAAAVLLIGAAAMPAAAGSRVAKAPAPAKAKTSPVAWEPTLDAALRAAGPTDGVRKPVFLLRVIGRREGCT